MTEFSDERDRKWTRKVATIYCRSMQGLIRFFLLFSLLSQGSPLRVCMWESLTTGTNCHTKPDASESAGLPLSSAGECFAAVSDHDESCVCSRPQASANRANLEITTAMLPPTVCIASFILEPHLSGPRRITTRRHLSRPRLNVFCRC